jgi:hypothetical protein
VLPERSCPQDRAGSGRRCSRRGARLELTDLWGIAGRLAARLNAIGITTPLELHDADHRLIRERFSGVLERMVLELRGVACIGLEDVTPDRKSLIASRSFGQSVETRRGLEEAVSVYTARAAEKMRRQNLVTASLAVWIETNSFKPEHRQYHASKALRLPVATADTDTLIAAAMTALGIIFKPGYRYKNAGVTFLDLAPSGRVQSGLFDRPDDARSISSMPASALARSASAREANAKPGVFGGNSVRRASQRTGTSCCAFKAEPDSLQRPIRASHAVYVGSSRPFDRALGSNDLHIGLARFRPGDINQFLESNRHD